jgi:hypothetical protein
MERHIIEQGKVIETQNRDFEWIDEIITKFHPLTSSIGYPGPLNTQSRKGLQNRLKPELDLPIPMASNGWSEW